jgi:hypothetical protein
MTAGIAQSTVVPMRGSHRNGFCFTLRKKKLSCTVFFNDRRHCTPARGVRFLLMPASLAVVRTIGAGQMVRNHRGRWLVRQIGVRTYWRVACGDHPQREIIFHRPPFCFSPREKTFHRHCKGRICRTPYPENSL